ncbi:MAG: hypothetical protein DHS20C10_14130 [marine bacterium B5-7]|nr:MAG: hypothetical protein DHS20C10_14130 [marine bacterium B5-7]
MKKALESITVKLLGKQYTIRCPQEEAEMLQQCAVQLDKQMQAVQQTNKIAGNEQIAIVAALNVVGESLQQQQLHKQQRIRTKQRIHALKRRITDCLSPQAQMPLETPDEVLD